MLRRFGSIVLAALSVLALVPSVAADPPTFRTGYIPVAVGTPDEALLHYKVALPDPAVWGPGPYPAVIDYSGYEPAIDTWSAITPFVNAGYAGVGLNIRGTGCSSGHWDYFEPVQSRDGAEAIGWLATQEWSNGRFGMVGKSYPGITQPFVAAEQPEPLKAIVPGHIFADLYRDVPYPGGIMNVTFAGGWSLTTGATAHYYGPAYAIPAGDQQCMINQAEHALNPPFNPVAQILPQAFDGPLWRERSPWEFADRIQVPTMLVESWQDEQVGSRGTYLLERLDPSVPWKFIGTNGDHDEYYGSSVMPHIQRFLSYHLKQEIPPGDRRTVVVDGIERPETFEEAFARYLAEDPVVVNWETGALGGRTPAWSETYGAWPPPEQRVKRLWLTPDGAMTQGAPARGSVDYTYAPGIGAEQRGGFPVADEPPASWTDRAPDGTAARFTSEALTEDHALLGTASLDLWLTSTAADTDLEVTLSEVRADGGEVFVQQGWLRASHRAEDPGWSTELRPFHTHRATDVQPLLPDEPSLLRVEIFPFGHVFRAGSRLRITIAAPHTRPDPWGFAALPSPAINTIHTGGAYRSSIALPLLAGAQARAPQAACGSARNQPCRPA